MAIANRDLGSSEQKHAFGTALSTAVAASAGISYHVAQVPYPCTLKSVSVAAASISGAPQVAIDIKRWTAGGVTTIPYVSSTLAVLAYGASAAYQLPVLNGSTLVNLQAGDVIVLNQLFSGGNVAIGGAVVTAVVQAVQDIKTWFGSTEGN